MRVLNFILILSLGLAVVFAQQEATVSEQGQKNTDEQLKQKIKMVNNMLHSPGMLQRLESSDDELAKGIMARAAENFLNMEEYYDRGQFLEAEAIIDSRSRSHTVVTQPDYQDRIAD